MPFDPFNSHVRWPPWLNPLDGHTAELPSGLRVGQLAQAAYNHMVNWRFQGPCVYTPHQTSSTARNPGAGIYYIITHYPDNMAGEDRRIALFWGQYGYPVAAAYSLDWADPNDATNDVTILSGTVGATSYPLDPPTGKSTVVEYAETGNANGFDLCTLTTSNYVLSHLTGVHVPRAAIVEDQLNPKMENVAPGQAIAYLDRSFRGLMERQHDESALVFAETMERISRRCFFNHTQVDQNRGTGINVFTNIYGHHSFPAMCRDLFKTQGTRYCYPALVIDVDDDGGAETVQIRLRSLKSGNTWTYTYQNGVDPAYNNPFLVTFNRTGASDTSGIKVAVENDAVYTDGDYLVVEGIAPRNAVLDVYATSCWEGAAV